MLPPPHGGRMHLKSDSEIELTNLLCFSPPSQLVHEWFFECWLWHGDIIYSICRVECQELFSDEIISFDICPRICYYSSVDKYRINTFPLGYFLGDFPEAIIRTNQFEVAYKTHKKGESWPNHAQKVAIEVNLIISGHMLLNNTHCKKGDIIVVHPGEFIKPTFLSDVKVIVVKIPSLPGDKILLDK